MGEPTEPKDGTNKEYVDNKVTEGLLAYRIRDLFGVAPTKQLDIILPNKCDNIAVVYYSVDPEGNANISNSSAITVQAGQSVETRDNFTVKFSDDMASVSFINNNEIDSILGQYYGYNNI